jgi:hypothetical protein
VQQILPSELENTLMQAGFSKDAANNLILMTKAVIDGKTKNATSKPVRFPTDFKTYLKNAIK